MEPILNTEFVKPFLRWAGGKTWLIKHINELVPRLSFKNYHEPFLGSGALFFNLNTSNTRFLSDLNNELIDTYLALQDNVDLVIGELGKFKNTESDYYRIRSAKYRSAYKKAARFIYLNQTSFNGIYRVNLSGEYNVPFGYRSKNFFDPLNLRRASEALKKCNIFSGDFDLIRKNVRKGDFVFLDPPYTVTHNDNGFIKYNQKLFSLDDQHRLSDLIDFICKKGAFYILTNAAHAKVEEIFEKGHNKFYLHRASLIGGLNAARGLYKEVIFTNVN